MEATSGPVHEIQGRTKASSNTAGRNAQWYSLSGEKVSQGKGLLSLLPTNSISRNLSPRNAQK